MDKTPTPHIGAKKGEFAPTVIMPGDPNRAKFIAEKFLTDAKLINSVRGELAYTGLYKGKPVSVMASGMGNPSMGIYSYELFNFYNVKNIIRVGTCGANNKDIKLASIVLGDTSVTKTNYANISNGKIVKLQKTQKLAKLCEKVAKKLNFALVCGNLFCTDTFYGDELQAKIMADYNCVAVEMESAALYFNAQKYKKNALALCSVSDNLITGECLTADERETSFSNMIVLALEVAVSE